MTDTQTDQTENGGILKTIKDNKLIIAGFIVVIILLAAGYWWFMVESADETAEHFGQDVTNKQLLIVGLVAVAVFLAMSGASSSDEKLYIF